MGDPSQALDLHAVAALRRSHAGWRLLTADNAPLLICFFHRAFLLPNVRSIARDALISQLEDLLFRIRAEQGDAVYPQSAAQYVDEWASDGKSWLRKYYVGGSDEPHFDLMPATEKAIEWVLSLRQRSFVGTESRLLTVFELLRQLVHGTNDDPAARLSELEKRRTALDHEIEKVRTGRLELMSSAQVMDRFEQAASTARGILSAFRELEQSFRDLDRSVRERIATWHGSKGELLQEIFGERDAISDSDQGKSFRAFWEFLMSPERQEELAMLLRQAFELEAVRQLQPDARLLNIHHEWLDAGEVAQGRVRRLSEQLRRYLSDQAFLEDRRVVQLIRSIEESALQLRERPPAGDIAWLDALAPDIDLPMERPLYSPERQVSLRSEVPEAADDEVDVSALFVQHFVDRGRLRAHIQELLRDREQVSLLDVLERHPPERGIAELVTYLAIASEDQRAVVQDEQFDQYILEAPDVPSRRVRLPRIIFSRR